MEAEPVNVRLQGHKKRQIHMNFRSLCSPSGGPTEGQRCRKADASLSEKAVTYNTRGGEEGCQGSCFEKTENLKNGGGL